MDEGEVAGEAAQHEEVAVREVHDPEHAERQRQPDGAQRVQRPLEDGADEDLHDGRHGCPAPHSPR